MTTALDSSGSPPKPRSLLSRIASPFSSKVRNVLDFHIQTDEPYRHYSSGDVVKGSVFLTVLKPARITHLVIALRGFVKVFKNATAPGAGLSSEGVSFAVGRGKRGSEYFGNGFASIFEDEIVLCGEGRLKIGAYVFKFELELPPSGLPTSIDFERGTISYILTSTLTRPTAISPTLSCDRKVYLIEGRDIASLRVPKPRIISLEPISKRSLPKSSSKKVSLPVNHRSSTTSSRDAQSDQGPDIESAQPLCQEQPPRSPVPSELSSVSAMSSNGASSQHAHRPIHAIARQESDCRSSTASTPSKTITATTELLRGGCLPGDILPVKISIDHTKPIKSLQGIIITLYRQGRIDMHPVIPLGPLQNGKKPEYEDYYPKSRTGLGGLSLASAGSSSVFRMDLAQTFTPLIIDPSSLTAVVKASIRVPEDVFPTISSVPGGMISFKYYVEVVMDLRGKLASQDRLLPRLGIATSMQPTHEYLNKFQPQPNGLEGKAISILGNNFLDTDQIRREKSVVACLFEVLIGTRDSTRKQTRKAEHTQNTANDDWGGVEGSREGDNSWHYANEEMVNDAGNDVEHNISHGIAQQSILDETPQSNLETFRLPEIEEHHDEKTRLQRAEERLFPSAPHLDDAPTSSRLVRESPSAPLASDLQEGFHLEGPSAPAYVGPGTTPMGIDERQGRTCSHHSNGANGDDQPATLADGDLRDDKQEMERQRLLMAVSEPEASNDNEGQRATANIAHSEPSAPILNEDG